MDPSCTDVNINMYYYTHTHATSLCYYTHTHTHHIIALVHTHARYITALVHTHTHTRRITALLKRSSDFLSGQDKVQSPNLAPEVLRGASTRTAASGSPPAAGSACCLAPAAPLLSLSSALTSGLWASMPSCRRRPSTWQPPPSLSLSLLLLFSIAQPCPTLGDHMDCSPPASSVHGILQARILERVAISSSRGSSQPRNQTRVSCIAGRFFTVWATRKAPDNTYIVLKYCLIFIPQNSLHQSRELINFYFISHQKFYEISKK